MRAWHEVAEVQKDEPKPKYDRHIFRPRILNEGGHNASQNVSLGWVITSKKPHNYSLILQPGEDGKGGCWPAPDENAPENLHTTIAQHKANTDAVNTSLQFLIEHRQDLASKGDWNDETQSGSVPYCRCCTQRTPSGFLPDGRPKHCTKRTDSSGKQGLGQTCPHIGQCCDRSTLEDPHAELMKNCQVCNVYKPCDTRRCAARPDEIRSWQHYPLALGALAALLGNCHVLSARALRGV